MPWESESVTPNVLFQFSTLHPPQPTKEPAEALPPALATLTTHLPSASSFAQRIPTHPSDFSLSVSSSRRRPGLDAHPALLGSRAPRGLLASLTALQVLLPSLCLSIACKLREGETRAQRVLSSVPRVGHCTRSPDSLVDTHGWCLWPPQSVPLCQAHNCVIKVLAIKVFMIWKGHRQSWESSSHALWWSHCPTRGDLEEA